MKGEGFTLVEMLVVVGITLIIGTLLVSLLISQSGVYYKQNTVVNVGINLNDAVSKINSNIKQAAAVTAGYPEISPTYVTGSEVLVLKLVSINTNGPISDVFDYVVVSKDTDHANVLRMQVFPDPQSTRESSNTVLTSLLDSVQFEYLDNAGNSVVPANATSVGLNLTITSQAGGTNSSRTSKTVTNLRNML